MLDRESHKPSKMERFITSGLIEPVVMAAAIAAVTYALLTGIRKEEKGAPPKHEAPNKRALEHVPHNLS